MTKRIATFTFIGLGAQLWGNAGNCFHDAGGLVNRVCYVHCVFQVGDVVRVGLGADDFEEACCSLVDAMARCNLHAMC